MKRRFTILTAALALLTFLAVPMGMWGQTTVTYKLTIEASDFNSTSYAANNNEKTSLAVCTTDNTKTYEVNWTSYQIMLQSGDMQWQKNAGKIYNSTNLGTITNVTVTSSAGTFTTYYGTSEQPAYGNSGAGKGYFKTFVGGATGKSSKVEVLFEIEESGSDLEDSDLALTGAPVALSFDLYNNASAQTVSYTTSSTGAITITPETSEYFTYEHNTTAKTITVTPVAVTPSPQTVTISQVADDTYAAGSASFTVAISAPSIVISESQLSLPCGANESGSFSISFTNGFVPNVAISPTFYSDADCLNPLPTSGDAAWIVITETDQNSINYSVTANTSTAARTAYLKVNAASNYTGNVVSISNVFTVTQAAPDYATLPFTYDGNGAGNLPIGFTVSGLGTYSSSPAMKFDDSGDYAILKINERPGILTFDIKGNTFSGGTFKVQTSEDGVTYTDLKTYTALGNTQSEEFTNLGENVRYIKWIYTNKSSGNVALGNIALAKYVAPNPYNLTVSLNDNVNAIYVFNAADQNNPLIADGAAGTIQVLERTSIMISPVVASGYVLASLVVNNENVIDQLDESGAYTFTMPSQDVAISATAMVTTTYTLATTIESGKTYIIVNQESSKAMGLQNSNNRAAVEVVIANETITVSSDDVYEFVISTDETNSEWFNIYDNVNNGYLYAAGGSGTSAKNHLKTQTTLTDNGRWTISFNEGKAIITAQGDAARKIIRYNNNDDLFSCYASGQQDVYLYVKDEPATETHTLTVLGYADYSAKDGYCLIASPVTVDPATVEGMVVANTDPNYQYFDLYSFANNQDEEWRNYKNTNFDLVPGTGYLYAKKATTEGETFSFELTGAPYSGDGEILLTQGTGNWADWNLVGNPYGVNAEISMDYYEMNGDGSGLMAGVDQVVDAMQGVFVEYTENDQTVSFVPQRGANPGVGNKLVLNLVRNRGTVIDRAIVRFGEGRQMTKFTLFENNTKLYIPLEDDDYAIVRSEAQGELPVSFRASENGTYTIAVEAENVDMNYLHLIDNMTGMDVDLLQTPSYTFEANTNDYANRFKLVFAANGTDEADESSFAFFSNGNLIVNNEGNATLQVIDINGRILSSETISGSCSKAINATTGVYMLRLINGENVKVQKVVVR